MANSARIDELLKKFDENPKRYFAPLANEYRKSGDLDQAIAICREHLAQQPGHMSGHVVFGQALYEKGDLDEARQVFETALALDPENLIALRHLGDIARDRYDMSTARMWYQRVLDSDPRNEEIFAQLAALGDAPFPPSMEPAAPAGESLAIEHSEGLGDGAPFASRETPATDGAPSSLDDLVAVSRDEASIERLELDAPSFGLAAPTEPRLEMPEPERVSESESPFDMAAFGSVEPAPLALEPDEPAKLGSAGFESAGFESHHFEAPSEPISASEDLGLESAEFVPPAGDGASDGPATDADLVFGFGDLSAVPPAAHAPEAAGAPAPRSEDADRDVHVPTAGADLGETPAAFVTETMAELYLQQGFRQEALNVYRQLLEQSPDDSTLRVRVERLEAEIASGEGADASANAKSLFEAETEEWPAPDEAAATPQAEAAPAAAPPAGPTVRQFFTALAARRPARGEGRGNGVSGAVAGVPAGQDRQARMEQPPVGLDAAPPTAFDSGEAVRNEANESGTSQLQSAAAEHDETESYFEAASEGFADVAPQGPMAGTAHGAGVTGPADRQGATDSSPRAAAFGYGYDDPAAERASAASAPPENSSAGGSLDELFGAPGVPGEDEAAASMLARLYDPTAHSASAAPGSATRPASSELSLDQVFRETPRSLEAARRASFSFDQFFASAAEPSAATPDAAPGAQGDDDESAARDIEQFHAWLEGLKKK